MMTCGANVQKRQVCTKLQECTGTDEKWCVRHGKVLKKERHKSKEIMALRHEEEKTLSWGGL